MTANRTPGSADADLIRYIDNEMMVDERARLDAALATDSVLAERLIVLRRRSRRLASLISAADPSAQQIEAATRAIPHPPAEKDLVPITAVRPTRSARQAGQSSRAWLRAAAILLALAGTAMIVPPVRAWIINTLERLTAAPAVSPAPAPVTPEAAPRDGGLSIGIPSDGASFDVTIDRAQAAGTITLRNADVEVVTASITADAREESFLALTEALRIINTAASTASYEIVVPARVSGVALRIGTRPAVVVTLDGSTTRVIRLDGR